MVRSRTLFLMTTSAAVLLLAGLVGRPAQAAGPFDGNWELDAPSAGGSSAEGGDKCPALRLRFEIKDGRVQGRFERSFQQTDVETAEGREGSAFTGRVQPDGSLTTEWESIPASGKITGDTGELKWVGGCGPRVGKLSRIG